LPTDCPACEGKGVRVVKAGFPHLKRVRCKFCKGSGLVSFEYAEALSKRNYYEDPGGSPVSIG
jgi:DnaJ-class molecular chaperone